MSQKFTIIFEDNHNDIYSGRYTTSFEKEDIIFDDEFYKWLLNAFDTIGCPSIRSELEKVLDNE